MKKISLLLCVLCVSAALFGQKTTTVKGFVKQKRNSVVKLFTVENGQCKVLLTTPIESDGAYCFSFVPEKPGFYAISDFRVNYPIYVTGGEQINIDLLEKKAVLTGENTKKNKALYQWEDFANSIRYQSVVTMVLQTTYKEFFPEFTEFITKIDSIKGAISSGDTEFDALIRKKIDYDLDFYASMFLMTPRTVHPQRSDWPTFYNTIISDKKFTSDDVLQFPEGLSMINAYVNFSMRMEVPNAGMEILNNDRLRGEAFLWKLQASRVRSDFDNYMEAEGKYLATDDQKARAKAIGDKLGASMKGMPAKDFTYPDMNGKKVSLSDFKGKVVVVDVWATWCGPCKGELPFLKKLEEEMHGQDVVFIGVSVDEAKDRQKWADFVKNENLLGVQLHASGWGQIAKDYKIKGIPRFMVFDKKGNIVSDSAPRPSNPMLKKMIEDELKK
ncbi:TlpA family protein disulfide reductase [Butyricimonas virosa]|uniref:TlpA family protein disulfide reductase n=1 Tax=Butyricimonas virosa TaxID=544645 RepID=UPI000EE0F1B9|nr:TlpA family protein disulfide reductase [Butyricimonas virosa]HAH74537.1 hypothetical protein [Butyricimonas virosa]HAP18464.1 hypothetical protein [Butyricimonas virosa]